MGSAGVKAAHKQIDEIDRAFLMIVRPYTFHTFVRLLVHECPFRLWHAQNQKGELGAGGQLTSNRQTSKYVGVNFTNILYEAFC